MFIHNVMFFDWFKDYVYTTPHQTEHRQEKRRKQGLLAKIYRWTYHQLIQTGLHDRRQVANEIKSKGWIFIDIPVYRHHHFVPVEHIVHQIAVSLQNEYFQLNKNTTIYLWRQRGSFIRLQNGEQLTFDANYSEIGVVNYSTREIMFKEFGFRIDDDYYFAVAYDALEDILYVKTF